MLEPCWFHQIQLISILGIVASCHSFLPLNETKDRKDTVELRVNIISSSDVKAASVV
jgi:hypothetical protein